jgi:hypothetical protein
VTLILYIYKKRKGTLPTPLPSSLRRVADKWRVSTWLPVNQPQDDMKTKLVENPGAPGEPVPWDYRDTFAKGDPKGKARTPFRKSLTWLLGLNPLGMNPVRAVTPTSTKTSSGRSHRSSIARRQSATSSHYDTNDSRNSLSPQLSEPDPVPPLPPAYVKYARRSNTGSGAAQETGFEQWGYRESDGSVRIPIVRKPLPAPPSTFSTDSEPSWPL